MKDTRYPQEKFTLTLVDNRFSRTCPTFSWKNNIQSTLNPKIKTLHVILSHNLLPEWRRRFCLVIETRVEQVFPHLFRLLPIFHECLYNTIKHGEITSSITFRKHYEKEMIVLVNVHLPGLQQLAVFTVHDNGTSDHKEWRSTKKKRRLGDPLTTWTASRPER